ncbi:uncharacterized protein LOC120411876 [Corvus cornix cornix]|uniref:uncharacterized protein LOC120411876 n=1 Tax=Corvus cornix cornix TaxID=932674 RepID=UPI00195120B9|nr:uncharacterized protein LOC120411876 [Corvus cornix cornix]
MRVLQLALSLRPTALGYAHRSHAHVHHRKVAECVTKNKEAAGVLHTEFRRRLLPWKGSEGEEPRIQEGPGYKYEEAGGRRDQALSQPFPLAPGFAAVAPARVSASGCGGRREAPAAAQATARRLPAPPPRPTGPHDIIGTARDRSPPAAGSGGRSSAAAAAAALRAEGERRPCRGRNRLTRDSSRRHAASALTVLRRLRAARREAAPRAAKGKGSPINPARLCIAMGTCCQGGCLPVTEDAAFPSLRRLLPPGLPAHH